MGKGREGQVYRVRQLPLRLENRDVVAPFLAGIASILGGADNIRVFSLAREKPEFKTATLSFKTVPSIFDNDDEQWTLQAEVVCGRNIIFDTHFRGFTVLNEPQHGPHTVDCVAISGLASHPFGSWKHREPGSNFMWLRDRLPQDVPKLRSLIYGYDTKLFKSRSFQDLDDIAWSFIVSLKEIRRSLSSANPVILLAHSLGGIVLKRALVLLAEEINAEEKKILESVKGLVFFGVPHRGMEISHFLAMVAKQPNEDLINKTLSPDSILLPELDRSFTELVLRIKPDIQFVYETAESQLTEQTSAGSWKRSDTSYAVLVNKDSAVPSGTPRRNAIPVNQDHSNMVKFSEDDPVYQVVMRFLLDLSNNVESQRIGLVESSPTTPVRKDVRRFSTIPFSKDPGFVGREDILAQLESEFANPMSQRWASLFGLGGIGKSQIAIEYSYRLVERSSQLSTFWVHASSKQRFEDSYEKIVTEVKIAGIGDGKVDTLQVVSNWLANQDNGPWLLILDNADEAAVLLHPPESDTGTGTSSVQRRLLDFLPRVQHGAVLITSRDRTCVLALTGSCGAPIKVQSMSTSEAVALLRNKLPDAIEEEAAKLVKELENVPLAVSQASAYIKEVSLASIPTYLEKFRRSNEDQAALLNKHKEDLRRDSKVSNAVVTSWELSFKQIREMSRGSADILSLMSYVNRQAIPRSLLQGDVDDITFNETFEPLISFSLVRAEIGGDTFELHRLVQVVLQHWLCNEGTDQLWKERAIERVAQKFPFSEGQYQHWPVCEALMSHADEVILHTTSSKECQLNCASILIRTACYLIERKGASGLAEQKSTRAREIRQQHFADDSDEIFETSSMLAIAYENQFKIKEAIDLQEFILKQQRKRWGPENSKTLVAMHNLAFSYHTSGRNQEAEDLLIHVVEVRERESGSEDLQFLISGNALVSVRVDRGKYEEAEKLGSKILKISLQCHGVENVHTLNAMTYLSLAHLRQKKFKEAKNLISQAIPPMTKVFGPSHLRTLDARICLAEIYYGQSKLDEAEELCTSCLDTARETYGPQHLTTLTIMNLLALIYQRQRKFIDALGLLKDVLDSYKRALGPNYPETLVVLSNIALCYDDMGEKEHAIQLMTEVYDKRREVLHANHPDIADSADWLAHWKREEEETEEEKGQEMEKRRRRKRARRHHT